MYLNFNIKIDNLVIRKLLNMFGATWVFESIFSGGEVRMFWVRIAALA